MRVSEIGEVSQLADFARFDVAERYAAEVAESIARNDHDRVRRGVECSGTRAILMDHDLWEIVHDRSAPRLHALPAGLAIDRLLAEAWRRLWP